MSLPSIAKFYKDNRVVGAAGINVGWWISTEGIVHCLHDALKSAMDFSETMMLGIPSMSKACNSILLQ